MGISGSQKIQDFFRQVIPECPDFFHLGVCLLHDEYDERVQLSKQRPERNKNL